MNVTQEKVKRMWKYLKENGIHSEEELDIAIKKMPPLDIGIFVLPLKRDDEKK